MRGGKRPGAGRPAPFGARTERIAIRFTPEEVDLIATAAEDFDLPVSEFVREVVRKWLTESNPGVRL